MFIEAISKKSFDLPPVGGIGAEFYYPGILLRHFGRSEAESRNPAKGTVILDYRLRGADLRIKPRLRLDI